MYDGLQDFEAMEVEGADYEQEQDRIRDTIAIRDLNLVGLGSTYFLATLMLKSQENTNTKIDQNSTDIKSVKNVSWAMYYLDAL